jgi:hypothetical protein
MTRLGQFTDDELAAELAKRGGTDWRALADDLADALIWLVELAATTSIDRGIANYPEIAGPLARYREASQR